MTLKFKLEIELGNEAMKDQHDVAKALASVADYLRRVALVRPNLGPGLGKKIMDQNGNSVGSWEVVNADEET